MPEDLGRGPNAPSRGENREWLNRNREALQQAAEAEEEIEAIVHRTWVRHERLTRSRGVVPDIVFPTAVDSDDYGERALENALPWATVRPARYTRHSPALAGEVLINVRRLHESRIEDDPGHALRSAASEAQGREAGGTVVW